MNNVLKSVLAIPAAAAALLIFAGCENNGGDSAPDVGDNDVNVVVCLGDSITDGTCAPDGAPYPSRLASLAGKTVVNSGVCGSTSDTGVGRLPGLLDKHKPGYLCVLYGINDLDFGRGRETVIQNLTEIIRIAKANNTVTLVATLTPTYDSHGFIASTVRETNQLIRDMAKQEGARLVDLEKAFGDDRSLVQEDGLHPSDAGTQVIAETFNGKI